MMPKTSFAIQVIRSRYEGMISMFVRSVALLWAITTSSAVRAVLLMLVLQLPPLRVNLSNLSLSLP